MRVFVRRESTYNRIVTFSGERSKLLQDINRLVNLTATSSELPYCIRQRAYEELE